LHECGSRRAAVLPGSADAFTDTGRDHCRSAPSAKTAAAEAARRNAYRMISTTKRRLASLASASAIIATMAVAIGPAAAMAAGPTFDNGSFDNGNFAQFVPGFDFDRLPNLNRAVVHDLATCRFIDEKVSVLIAGPFGTGKSHLAQALGHAAARKVTMSCS